MLASLEAEALQIEGAIAPLEARIVSMVRDQLKRLEEEEKEKQMEDKSADPI